MSEIPEKIFEISNLSYSYPTGDFRLSVISLDIYIGERIAFIGPNGAGKSSLARVLTGLIKEYEGEVSYKGCSIKDGDNKWPNDIGVFFQDPDDMLFCNTVLEDVAFWPSNQNMDINQAHRLAMQWLAYVGLEDISGKAPHNLSYGQKKRVALAAVFAGEPKVVILDEPTANLDSKQREKFIDLLRKYEGTLVLISHDYYLVNEICQRVLSIADGKLLNDSKVSSCPDLRVNPYTCHDFEIIEDGNLASDCELGLKNYNFQYPDGTYGLRSVNIDIPANKGVAIIGDNGAGKSTLVKCLATILRGEGELLYEGEILAEKRFNELWKDVGIVFQNTSDQLFCPTCLEEAEFGPKMLGFSNKEARCMAIEALEMVGLESCQDVVPLNLSGGERRRLALASVLSMKPRILILDEPTANLDIDNCDRLMTVLNKLKVTKIIVSHDSMLIKKCCSIGIVVQNGEVGKVGSLVEKTIN